MNEASFDELRKNVQLTRSLWAEARRHFGRDDHLQADAVGKAWVRIVAQPIGQSLDDYKGQGARAIRALYQRTRRKRGREASIDGGEKGKPPGTLAKLAQKAIRGDWEVE